MEPHPLAEVLAILPMFDRDLVVQSLGVAATGIDLFARVAGRDACCPYCETRSDRVHGRYVRRLADLAWQGTPVRLHLQVRRFCCMAASCRRRTFTERLPTFAPPHARRTGRLADLVTRVGLALGGEAGARLLPSLGAATSAATVLRLVRRVPDPPAPPTRVLGVDEWAHRKGHSYGTILVDLERRRPVALLDDRSAESFAGWLREHPGVEVVARDRSEIYAEGARQGAPKAVQVADRWHLLKNVGDVIERVLQRQRSALERAARATAALSASAGSAPETPTADASHSVEPGARATADGGLPRGDWYQRIHALRREGVSFRAISAELGLSRVTVRKYARAPICPTTSPKGPTMGIASAFDARLRLRWDQGCRNARVLWNELRVDGFGGSYRTVRRHVATWRIDRRPSEAGRRPSPSQRAPSPRQVRWWLILPDARLTPSQRCFTQALLGESEPARQAQALAVDFGRLLRARNPAALEPWLCQAEASGVAEFRDFAVGLRRDTAAAQAAIASPWSNGQTEGQVNKIKMLKRQMYGRASVALLRQRLLHAA